MQSHTMNILEKDDDGVWSSKLTPKHVTISKVELYGERDQHVTWVINDKYLIDCDLTSHLLK